jgi:FkbM family methyltransferase
LLAGEIRLLSNWRQLRHMARRAIAGETIPEPPVICFRSGLRINMVPASHAGWDFLFEEIFLSKCYQPTADFIPKPGWTVVDLGANMGFFSCQVSAAAPDVRIVAVEPLPLYQETFRKNIQDNKIANATLVAGAICGEVTQTVPLTVWYATSGELKTGEVPQDAARVETVTAKGYTLAEVFEIGNVVNCDLLKVDIEGAEFSLFEKIPASLWKRIARVVMEVHPDRENPASRIVQILEQNDFRTHLSAEASAGIGLLWAIRK